MNPTKTAIIMAGGTGGHVFPGIAIAQALQADGWTVQWFGHPDGMEAQWVAAHGISMVPILFKGVRGKGLLRWLTFPLSLFLAGIQAGRALLKIQPQCVISMGGYIALPGGLAAACLRIPLIVHEQNAIAGHVNKILAIVANVRCVAFPGALKKAQHTGNPVRQTIVELPDPCSRYTDRTGPLNLLIVGGSLGAQALNQIVPQALSQLPTAYFNVTHQAGAKHITDLQSAYDAASIKATLCPFIDDMANAYRNADLIICRAGAMTISELAAAGIASILVPYPHAVDDHQTHNALFLVNNKAAILLDQHTLTAENLAHTLRALDRATLQTMAIAARALHHQDACALMIKHCNNLLKSPRHET